MSSSKLLSKISSAAACKLAPQPGASPKSRKACPGARLQLERAPCPAGAFLPHKLVCLECPPSAAESGLSALWRSFSKKSGFSVSPRSQVEAQWAAPRKHCSCQLSLLCIVNFFLVVALCSPPMPQHGHESWKALSGHGCWLSLFQIHFLNIFCYSMGFPGMCAEHFCFRFIFNHFLLFRRRFGISDPPYFSN